MPDSAELNSELDPKPYYSSAFGIGVVAAGVMTLLLWIARQSGLTQLDLAMSLGTVTGMTMGPTPGAWVQGFIAMLTCGGVFALVYAWIFEMWPAHVARAWLGAVIGAAHAVAGGAMLMWLMPPLHSTMKDFPLLSNPGFMGANYGRDTMIVFLGLHVIYGWIVGCWMHYSALDGRYLRSVAEKHQHHDHPEGMPPRAV